MKTLQVTWTGIRPLLMHNGLMVDPTNPAVRRIKEISSKGCKKMTDSDYEERNRIEWEAGLYWDEKDGPVIPSDNIERCVQKGAMKSRLGKDVEAAVFCTSSHVKLQYDGPRDKDRLYAQPERYLLRKRVCIQKAAIIRIRPMFPTGWKLEIELEFDDTIVNSKDLMKAMVDAGALVGIGDWRPKFGRFLVE
jgi:hypothetical protein